MTDSEQMTPCPPCADGEHATVEDNACTCCGATVHENHDGEFGCPCPVCTEIRND